MRPVWRCCLCRYLARPMPSTEPAMRIIIIIIIGKSQHGNITRSGGLSTGCLLTAMAGGKRPAGITAASASCTCLPCMHAAVMAGSAGPPPIKSKPARGDPRAGVFISLPRTNRCCRSGREGNVEAIYGFSTNLQFATSGSTRVLTKPQCDEGAVNSLSHCVN